MNCFQIETLAEFDVLSQLKLLRNLLSYSHNSTHKKLKVNNYPYKHLTPSELAELLDKCDDDVTQSTECIPKDVFLEILKTNSKRFDAAVDDGIEGSDEYRSIHSFINAICKPDVMEIVKANLINELSA